MIRFLSLLEAIEIDKEPKLIYALYLCPKTKFIISMITPGAYNKIVLNWI